MDLRAVYGDTFEVDHAPLVADFNGDGVKDVFIAGGKARYPNIQVNYGKAYCLSWGTGKGPDWMMFRHDARRSACVCDAAGLPLPPLSIPDNKLSNSSLRLYPSPANQVLRAEADLEGGDVTVRIVDVTGKTVWTEKVVVAGSFSWEKDISTLPPGSYIVELQCNGTRLSRPFAVIR
jgi:hypothetical protein